MHIGRYFKQGQVFHICNKSIANYGIYQDHKNIIRFKNAICFYNSQDRTESLADNLNKHKNKSLKVNLLQTNINKILKIIAYCIMPDHYHLLVKILKDDILSKYISDVENSFTRYFNIKFKRKGPLWQSRFRSVEVKTDEQLLHVSRYIHLNPTTSELVSKPEEWEFSSYRQYINNEKILKEVMTEITISTPSKYKRFCEDQIDYQKKLRKIKKLLLE
ncbi:hypothetical protein A3F29_02865 [Candidatus Roizmanbacteria bacterium RIFCSPHIGHO2_12_FULL_33_9]|uniref:Transposase IS200-like domain-containing protein n=1 Tax=Candidatus Roizmanbacteria bacterium RIFCSPHIGHO2_12_FULL_33_9 TaxID=1802045 RepID=A0A1F7HGZ9_9BACT|nr:MAG: hypothetical protein A3F29_02865 [Candidatus Roizmanbacteria bacterium RIFCSPHIGHO2_12_FULL_33_9]